MEKNKKVTYFMNGFYFQCDFFRRKLGKIFWNWFAVSKYLKTHSMMEIHPMEYAHDSKNV